MAQTGFTPISLYYTATAAATPTAGNLVAGELAINTNDGKLFYKDSSGVVQTIATKASAALGGSTTGTGALVLQTSPTVTTPTIDKINTSVANTSLGAGNASIMKNRIINGAMVIDQRNAGASLNPSDGQYSVDRWKCRRDLTSKYTIQQSTTAPTGFSNSLLVTSSSSYSVPSGAYYFLVQSIEGFNTADLGWGTANAKTVTLSFQVQSSLTGTFGGSLNNSAENYSYPFSYTISSANTWTQISVTITGPTAGTWIGSTNGTGINVNFGLGVGTSLSGTAGSWSANGYYSATGAVSVVGTNGATFYITGVQLEVGSSATGFEYVNYQTSLANCQRYYVQFLGNNIYESLASGMSSTTQDGFAVVTLPVTMRSNPTLSYSTVSLLRWSELANAYNGTALGMDKASPKTPFIYISVASGMTSYRAGFITANNSTSAYVAFSAEL